MSISFNSIPNDIRTPGAFAEFDNSRAVTGSPAMPNKALVIGILKASGTVPANTPQLIGSGNAAEGYWGAGSMIAEMARAFKNANAYTELWGIGLAETTTASVRTLTLSGTATAAGTLVTYIAGHRIETAVAVGGTAAAVSVLQNAAILAYADYKRLPFTTAQATTIVTLTAVHKGAYGSEIDVRHSLGATEAVPAGLTLTIAEGTPGSGQESMSAAITAMGDIQYNTIVIAATDSTSLTALEAEMATRAGPMVKKEGFVIAAALGTQSTLSSLGNGRNSQFLSIVSSGGTAGNSPTPLYVVAAQVAALRALQFGIDPARPMQTLPVQGMQPQLASDQFTRSERNTLLTDGISTTTVDQGGIVRLERLITTYQTNPLTIPDPSYLDATTMGTLSLLSFEVRARMLLKYPRHKLASDGTLFDPGQAIVTPKSIRAEFKSLFRSWERRGLVEDSEQFFEDLLVERDANDKNRINWRMVPNLANQLRVTAGSIQFLL